MIAIIDSSFKIYGI